MVIGGSITGRIKLSRFRKMYVDYFSHRENRPPYGHIVQLGDPVLRVQAKEVQTELIPAQSFQRFLKQMRKMTLDYKCEGLSAPQVGVDLQVFTMHLPKEMIAKQGETNLQPIPYQVWINPRVKILDHSKLAAEEGCASVMGYVAQVPRYTRLLLKGLDENGKERSLEASGRAARIIQHEVDHLNGRLYVDCMVPATLQCSSWSEINRVGGKVFLSFRPLKWYTNLLYPYLK